MVSYSGTSVQYFHRVVVLFIEYLCNGGMQMHNIGNEASQYIELSYSIIKHISYNTFFRDNHVKCGDKCVSLGIWSRKQLCKPFSD